MGRNLDPLSGDLVSVLECLTDLHDSGKSYSTVNTLRSMLSKTLQHVEGFPIGEHPLVKTLLNGCYNRNPPRPKYDAIWNPDLVIQFAKNSLEDSNLSMKELSEKTATLIALATLMRVSEIADIDFASITFSGSKVIFALINPTKTQRSGPRQSFVIDSSPEENACPVLALKTFITRSKEWKTDLNRHALFISLIEPHAPVTPNTVARWIKSYLSKSGVDT